MQHSVGLAARMVLLRGWLGAVLQSSAASRYGENSVNPSLNAQELLLLLSARAAR